MNITPELEAQFDDDYMNACIDGVRHNWQRRYDNGDMYMVCTVCGEELSGGLDELIAVDKHATNEALQDGLLALVREKHGSKE